MKTADGYMLKDIAGNHVIIPVGQNVVEYKSMLHINETGTVIWKLLEQGCSYQTIIDTLIKEYEVTPEETAFIKNDLDEFLNQMRILNLLVED